MQVHTTGVPVKMRQVQAAHAAASEYERQKAETKADCEADEIKIRPGHGMIHRFRLPSALAANL
jgi:hypothetical protein